MRAAAAVGVHNFGAGPGADTAAHMLRSQLADFTKSAYAAKWDTFVALFQASGYPFLPNTTEMVACHVGELYERGTVAPGTVQNYLTPIIAAHAMVRIDKTAVGPLLMALRAGFASLYADSHGGLRNKREPLPAAELMRMVNLGLDTTDVGLRERLAGLALTALTFALPDGGANLRDQGVIVTSASMAIQIANYKNGARTNREWLHIRIPRRRGAQQDRPWKLVYTHVAAVQAATSDPNQPLFAPIGTTALLPTEVATAWMRKAINLLNIPTPAGCVYSGHSLRSGAATQHRL